MQDSMPMPQENSKPDMDMIKQALMKVIDDMTALESDRHLPDGHPMKKLAISAEVKPEESLDAPVDDSEDPKMLEDLMGQADKADMNGDMPEDKANDLPPEIMDAVRRKKAEMGK